MDIKLNSYIFLTLMFIPFHTQALTYSEQICASKNIYFEARSNKQDWFKVLQVANNRKNNPKKYGAKSSHLCDIVHSSQYSTARFKAIKEFKVYKDIRSFVKRHQQLKTTSILYFSGNDKLHFRNRF